LYRFVRNGSAVTRTGLGTPRTTAASFVSSPYREPNDGYTGAAFNRFETMLP